MSNIPSIHSFRNEQIYYTKFPADSAIASETHVWANSWFTYAEEYYLRFITSPISFDKFFNTRSEHILCQDFFNTLDDAKDWVKQTATLHLGQDMHPAKIRILLLCTGQFLAKITLIHVPNLSHKANTLSSFSMIELRTGK